MVAYYFHMQSVPRTIGREEWYRTWQKVRVDRRKWKELEKGNYELLRRQDVPNHIRKHIIDDLINPPLALGPHM